MARTWHRIKERHLIVPFRTTTAHRATSIPTRESLELFQIKPIVRTDISLRQSPRHVRKCSLYNLYHRSSLCSHFHSRLDGERRSKRKGRSNEPQGRIPMSYLPCRHSLPMRRRPPLAESVRSGHQWHIDSMKSRGALAIGRKSFIKCLIGIAYQNTPLGDGKGFIRLPLEGYSRVPRFHGQRC
jgi:hypothetical protein